MGGDDFQEGENGVIDQLENDTMDCLSCESEFHRLAKIDYPVEISRDSLVAAVTPQLQDGAKSGENIKDRQREDMKLKRIIDFQEKSIYFAR